MNIVVERYVGEITKNICKLLLSADPDQQAVNRYLKKSSIFVAKVDKPQQEVIGVAVLLIQEKNTELKNIAVQINWQKQGVAKQLIQTVIQFSKALNCKSLTVGTGNSSLDQLALYQKCGFRITEVIPDFFANYSQPIIENGIQCIDMIKLTLPFLDKKV